MRALSYKSKYKSKKDKEPAQVTLQIFKKKLFYTTCIILKTRSICLYQFVNTLLDIEI